MDETIHWDDVSQFMSELRKMAKSLLSLEGNAQSVQPTALILTALRRQRGHDQAWESVSWKNRKYFFAAMYNTMGRALIDHARIRNAKKRQKFKTAQVEDLDFIDLARTANDYPEQLEALTKALEQLRLQHPKWAELVEHRFFGGFSIAETARIMDLAEKTVQRWWNCARSLLYDEVVRILNADHGEN